MEGEKKRKRAEEDGGGGRRRKKEKRDLEVKAEAAAAAAPSDEEVDEFFAILRRMRVAVKYFEKGHSNGDGRKLTGRWGSTATALEAEVLAGVDVVKSADETGGGVRKNRGLDLNAVPEADSNSL